MTNDRIIQGARTLFQKYGIKSVTMDDLAKEVGVSKRTLYEYFANKRMLVRSCLMQSSQEKELLWMRCSDQTIIDIIIAFHAYGKDLQGSITPPLARDIKRLFPLEYDQLLEVADNHILLITERMRQNQAEGLIRKEISCRLVIDFLKYHLRSMLHSSRVDLAEVLLIFLRGICTPHGLKIMEEKLTQPPLDFVCGCCQENLRVDQSCDWMD